MKKKYFKDPGKNKEKLKIGKSQEKMSSKKRKFLALFSY